MRTTIILDKNLVRELKKVKEYPRQTYKELISKMLSTFISFKSATRNNLFASSFQDIKIKEVWSSKEDDIWDKL